MTKHVLLNNVEHKNLRIITTKSAKYGDNVASTVTFPTEFRDVQSEYPIFFRKEAETDEFQAIAVFGLVQNENLFLDDDGWHASYIPAVINREPFLIGFQNQEKDGEIVKIPVTHVDMDSSRISTSDTEGELVYLPEGGSSPYIERVVKILQGIHFGVEASKAMFKAFEELDLMEPFTLDIQLNDGSQHKLTGFYTINEEKFAALDGDALAKLHKAGFLQSAFMVLASLVNVKTLVRKKNERIKNNP